MKSPIYEMSYPWNVLSVILLSMKSLFLFNVPTLENGIGSYNFRQKNFNNYAVILKSGLLWWIGQGFMHR